jgi:hypothetical protein
VERVIVVRGTLRGTRQIDLDEPLDTAEGPVEVVVRSIAGRKTNGDVFDYVTSLPAGRRTKADIDRQVHDERGAWSDR